MLLELPVKDVEVPGGELLEETSDPGRKDGGSPATLGRPVEVGRRYRYAGSYQAACERVHDQLASTGWSFNKDCAEAASSGTSSAVVRGALVCEEGYRVDLLLVVTGMTEDRGIEPNIMRLELTSTYPGDESLTGEPPWVGRPVGCEQ